MKFNYIKKLCCLFLIIKFSIVFKIFSMDNSSSSSSLSLKSSSNMHNEVFEKIKIPTIFFIALTITILFRNSVFYYYNYLFRKINLQQFFEFKICIDQKYLKTMCYFVTCSAFLYLFVKNYKLKQENFNLSKKNETLGQEKIELEKKVLDLKNQIKDLKNEFTYLNDQIINLNNNNNLTMSLQLDENNSDASFLSDQNLQAYETQSCCQFISV